MDWIERIPTWIKAAFAVGGPMLSANAERLPVFLQFVGEWAGLLLCALGVIGLARHFIMEYNVDRGIIVVCSALAALLLVASFGFYGLWPASLWLAADALEQPAVPDVALEFVGKTSPQVIIENNSDVVAETIKWSPVIWNLDDQRTYINPTPPPDTHDPLPIPTQTFDFLRPHAKSLPIALFDNVRSFVKPGQRLFGSVSVICPKCKRGRTYVISVTYGKVGWYWLYNKATEGERIVPKTGHKEDILPWVQSVEKFIPMQERINIP